ncbi:MAG: DUF1697 domain-containing protein [Actinomycetota bacterium]|nr:DUF1697 domain-containing protein [Actinomycetota bacterium]
MPTYVALLRGINVGGKNLIKMPALKACFEAGGFQDVVTYIQSGNVLFRATGSASTLARRIETMLGKTFDHYRAFVVVRSRSQMRTIVENAPEQFGADPGTYLYDVVFLKEPLTARSALKAVPMREGVDEVFAGRGVLYFSRVKSMATRSRLNRVASLPVYQNMTIRNWNTTTRLLRMMDEA